jgi:hypothetical protein
MIQISVRDDIIEKAHQLKDEMPELKNSIRNNAGMLVGFIGELVVAEYLGTELQNTYDYDIIFHNVKIDVKTKEVGKKPGSNSTPKPHYECSISAYNTTQSCDMYVFVRVDLNKKIAWILGWRGKDEYFEQAIFRRRGDIDYSNNKAFDCDCYQMAIKDLRSLEPIKNRLT